MKILFVMAMLFTTSAFAVQMKTVSCWKGFSSAEQRNNLQNCKAGMRDLQVCSSNWNEHQQAVFDVCLMEAASTPKKILSIYKGFSSAEQERNLKACSSVVKFGQLCVTNLWIHKQAAFDVVIME